MDRRDGYIMNEIMLRAENIERTYHAGSVDVPALKNCTLEFGQGEFTAIIGKSGSGKSTLLRILGSVDEPDTGFTAYENVVMPILIDGKKPDENEVDDLLEELGISHCKNKFPSQMSGGEQQRVAIARALITHPAVILADEPTGNLDAGSAGTVAQMLSKASQKHNQTIIMVTHDRQMADYADKIITIVDGVCQ